MIHQIYIANAKNYLLPKYFEMTTKTIADKMPGYQHKIYFNEELRNFINETYGNEMLMAYDRLIPFAYKADLARYLLLYHFGGWYFDISIRMINGVFVNDDIDFVTFIDFPQYTGVSYGCNNAIIYAKPKSIILEDLINKVYENIRVGFYGRNTLCIRKLCITPGPVCLA